jgi:hypothetical protein
MSVNEGRFVAIEKPNRLMKRIKAFGRKVFSMGKETTTKKTDADTDKPKSNQFAPDKYKIMGDEITKVSANEVMEELKPIAPGWSTELEKALRVPNSLYMRKDQDGLLLCNTPGMEIAAVSRSLAYDVPIPKKSPKYGITIEESASSTYFTLLDMERRIAIRVRLVSIHELSSRSWEKIFKIVKRSLEVAEKNKEKVDSVAYYNGSDSGNGIFRMEKLK